MFSHVVVVALQVEVNSGGNVYFCFCSSQNSRGQDAGGSVSSDCSPERSNAQAWDARGWHTSIAASNLRHDCDGGHGAEASWRETGSELQRRAASDDSAVRQLVSVLQAAADEESSAYDKPAAGTSPSGSKHEAVGGYSNGVESVGSPAPPHGLPSPPSTAAAACWPDGSAEGSSDGVLQQSLRQVCQQESAQSHPQPDVLIRQDVDSSQAAEHESSDMAQAAQPAHTDSGEPQPFTLQRQHSGSAPSSPDRQTPPDRLLVVKFLPARLDAQSEQFASELARHLGVPSPACRILRKQVP
jgi:hypothetical protein